MLVHVDDIDLITDSDDDVAIIFDLIDRKFGLVAGDPDVLLVKLFRPPAGGLKGNE